MVKKSKQEMMAGREAPRHERERVYRLSPIALKMVQHYIENGGKRAAYIHAYGRGNYSEPAFAVRIRQAFRRKPIVEEINRLQIEHAERHKMTVDDLLKELEEARGLAREDRQPSAMVSATMGKAKILGYDKQTIDHTTGGEPIQPSVIEIVAPKPKSED